MTAEAKVYREEECKGPLWTEFVNAMRSGKPIEIDEDMAYYWLEVLPPVSMGKTIAIDGVKYTTWFMFAEGAEPCVAFWKMGSGEEKRFFCQLTNIMNVNH